MRVIEHTIPSVRNLRHAPPEASTRVPKVLDAYPNPAMEQGKNRFKGPICKGFRYNILDKKIHLPGDLQEGPMTKMARTVLPFKLAALAEPMTAQSGLVLHGEFIQGVGFHRWLEQEMLSTDTLPCAAK
jgi:hypothetical protein